MTAVPQRLLPTLLLGAILCSSGTALAQDDPGRLLEQGRRAFEREDFEMARERLWAYLDATSNLTGPARLPQAEALYYIALMEPDAAVARRHYEIIVDEFRASPVADESLFRLAQLNLVEGQAELAIQRFEQLRKDYPVARHRPEIDLWIGQARLAAGQPQAAMEVLQEGFTQVKSGEVSRGFSMAQRDALAAEYAHWLAQAHAEAGDEQTAMQYFALLTLDYPDSPQAVDAREALAARGVAGGPLPVAAGPPAGEGAEAEPGAEVQPPVAERPSEQVEVPAAEVGPRDQEVQDIAVADPVAAAPRGVGRGGERPAERPAEEPPERPAEEPQPEVDVQPIRPAEPPAGQRREPERAVPIEELEPPAKFPPGTGAADLVYLQVGAFTSATRAADLSKRLKADGFNTTVQIAVVEGRGFYRVRVGPFRVSADAQRIDRDRSRLRELGYPVEQVPAAQ